MKQKSLLAITAIIILSICWNQTTATEITLPDTETIDYGIIRMDITFTGNVTLSYVYSSINSDALTMELWMPYNSSSDTTRYLFTSEVYLPDYWEQLDQEAFVFQDTNNGSLFIMLINMTDVEVPDSPWMLGYINKTALLNETYTELNEALYNLSISELELYDLGVSHMITHQELNMTGIQLDNVTGLYINTSAQVNGLITSLNDTKNCLYDEMSNATLFRRFYEEMTSYKSGFNFKIAGDNDQYRTIYAYESQVRHLEEQAGGFPILLIFAVMIAVVITMMIGYWKWAKKRAYPEEMEMLEGVDPTTTLVNRFFSRLKIKPLNVTIKEKETMDIPKINKKPETKPSSTNKNDYTTLQQEVDNKIQNMETKISTNHEEVMKQMQELLNAQKTPTIPK